MCERLCFHLSALGFSSRLERFDLLSPNESHAAQQLRCAAGLAYATAAGQTTCSSRRAALCMGSRSLASAVNHHWLLPESAPGAELNLTAAQPDCSWCQLRTGAGSHTKIIRLPPGEEVDPCLNTA